MATKNTMAKRKTQLSTKAWLLRGISSIPGTLKLSKGRLSFTAFDAGTCWGFQLRKLEAETGREGLAERLDHGKNTIVFDVPLADVQKVRFPWFYFSGGVKLTLDGVRYRFGFDKPANTRMPSEGVDLSEISKARRSGKAWKAVLLEQAE